MSETKCEKLTAKQVKECLQDTKYREQLREMSDEEFEQAIRNIQEGLATYIDYTTLALENVRLDRRVSELEWKIDALSNCEGLPSRIDDLESQINGM